MNRIELKQKARENVRKDKFSIILITLIATAILSAMAFGTFSLPLSGLFNTDFLTIAPQTGAVQASETAKSGEFDLDDFFDEDGNFDAEHYYGFDQGDGTQSPFQSPFQNPFAYGYEDDYYDYDYDHDYVSVDAGNAGLALAVFLIAGALTAGLLTYHRKIWRGEEGELRDLFSTFNKDFPRITKMYLLQTLYVFLWSLLLIVPGIIMAIAYSQAYFLMLDDPDLQAVDALNKSKELMRGRKWEYFVMYLSFIGWAILGLLTLGILYLWLNPYILQTVTGYYEEVIKPAKIAADNAAAHNGFVPEEPGAEPPKETVTEEGIPFTDVEAKPAAEPAAEPEAPAAPEAPEPPVEPETPAE